VHSIFDGSDVFYETETQFNLEPSFGASSETNKILEQNIDDMVEKLLVEEKDSISEKDQNTQFKKEKPKWRNVNTHYPRGVFQFPLSENSSEIPQKSEFINYGILQQNWLPENSEPQKDTYAQICNKNTYEPSGVSKKENPAWEYKYTPNYVKITNKKLPANSERPKSPQFQPHIVRSKIPTRQQMCPEHLQDMEINELAKTLTVGRMAIVQKEKEIKQMIIDCRKINFRPKTNRELKDFGPCIPN
jgi:hypothetical protein